MKIKANDMCPKCKHCLGMTPQGMYSCGYANDGSELNIGIDVVLNCENFEWFEWKDEKVEGRYPWGSDEDKVLKYCANDVTIIAEQVAREKQKKLEDKVEKYEKIFNDILDIVYKHPQLFEHNIHSYELLPGRLKFFKDSWEIMCDKYDPVFEENTKLKEEIERLKKSKEKLENKLNAKNKDIDILLDENKRLKWRNNNQVTMIDGLKLQCNDLSEKSKLLEERNNNQFDIIREKDKAGFKIVEENVKLENEKSELIKASKRKDELIQSYREKNKNYEQILIDISRFVPVDVTDFKDLPMIIEQMRKAGDKYDSVSESYDTLFDQKYELQKANEKLEDKVHKLERRLTEERKRFDRLDTELLTPIARALYPREAKICKPYSEVIEDIKELKKSDTYYDRYKTFTDKVQRLLFQDDHTHEFDEIIEEIKKRVAESDHYKEKSELLEEGLNAANRTSDLWKERCYNAETDVTTLNSKVEVLDKRNSNQSVMIGEKGKEIEKLKEKNRELQIRINDLLFQEKLNKSAFGYDYEEENGKLRVENERLRNENEYIRNRYPTYSAMKVEDKIEHIREQAKKWKRKYKEAYDILQEFFGEHSNIMSVSYDLSGDRLTLKLLYDDSAYTKYNRLEKARERMRKLD